MAQRLGIGTGWLCALLKSRAGNIMPMAAVAMIALAGLVGGGVDVSRAYLVKNRLQNACDSAVLAGRRTMTTNGFDTPSRARANSYFNTNFDEGAEGTSGTVINYTTSDNQNQLNGVAVTMLDTAVMQLFGYDEIDLQVACSASMSLGNSDIMMVLDTTGSMACTAAMTSTECIDYINANGYSETAHGGTSRIENLRVAMKNFHTTVSAAAAGTNARVRYGFVPYSSTVNVGALLYNLNPAYLADSVDVQSRVPVITTKQQKSDEQNGWEPPVHTTGTSTGNNSDNDWAYYSGNYGSSNSCSNNKPNNSSWSNNGQSYDSTIPTYINSQGQKVEITAKVQPQRRWEYRCVKINDSRYQVERRRNFRDYYDYDVYTSDPHFDTISVSVFDHWRYLQRNLNTAGYKSFASTSINTGTSGTAFTSTWPGCIEERQSVPEATFSYSKLLGMSPDGATDLDIDSAPTEDVASKWKPLWAGAAYYRIIAYNGNYYYSGADETELGAQAQVYCPNASRKLATMGSSTFNGIANSLLPSGGTYHDIGMIWGARLLSPDGIFSVNVNSPPVNGGKVARHIIFMTDGDMSTGVYDHSSYGVERYDKRVTDDGQTGRDARHTSRFLAMCAATKAKGIRIWVVAFASGLTTDLENCASPDSAFPASNAPELNAAFQDIAQTVGELRVTQ